MDKNKLSRRDFLRLGAFTAASALLASCKPTGPTATSEGPGAQPPAQEAITLKMWSHQNPSFIAANEATIAKFQDANPGVTIAYENFPYGDFIQTIQTSMAAKNEADVIEMFGSWVQSYARGGTLAEVPSDIMPLSQAQDLFYKAPLDGYVWEGKLYGLPNEYNLENGGVLVNKRMFEEAGIAFPPKWNSWDALVADAKKMVKYDGDVMTVVGFHYISGDGLGFLYWEGVLERGADYFASDGVHLNFLSPEAKDTVKWLVDMAVVHKVVDPFISTWMGDAFFQGRAAIAFIGPWIVPEGRRNYPDFADPWDYVRAPYYGEKMSFAADSGWGKVVSPNSKNITKAWEFAKFCAADKANARAWNVATGTVPALKAVAEDPTLLNDINWLGPSLEVLPYGRYVGMLQDRDYIWYNVIATRITECMQGQRSVDETMALMHQEANAMIDSKLGG